MVESTIWASPDGGTEFNDFAVTDAKANSHVELRLISQIGSCKMSVGEYTKRVLW